MVRGKKGPSIIAGDQFSVDAALNLEVVKSWTVETLDRAGETLYDWEGDIVGLVGTTLSGDNKSVHNSRFLLQGSLYRNKVKVVNANTYWTFPDRARHELVFEPLRGDLFVFRDTLVSNLVDSSEIEWSLRPQGKQPLMGTELDDAGFKGFCLRAFLWPTAPNWAKLNILLYPLCKEELISSHPLSVHAAFPGISVVNETIPLGPEAKKKERYGIPFITAVLPGANFVDFPFFPPAKEFVAATAGLMRKTTYPEVKSNETYLKRRWEELATNGDPSSLKSPALTLAWPAPTTSIPIADGRLASFFHPPPPLPL
jgi:hypothetical protein